MWIALTLTLFLTAPKAPEPFSGLSSAARAMFTDYLETRAKLGRTFEVVAEANERGQSRAVLLDRTGCVRGWVVLTSVAPKKGAEQAPSFEAVEYVGLDCKKPSPIAHFARIQDALGRRDAALAKAYFAPELHLPVATEGRGRPTRRTLTGDDVVAALKDPKAKTLPICVLTSEVPSCTRADGPDASGSVPIQCVCNSPSRQVTYELRELEPALGADSPIQVVSVKERLGKR